MRATRTSVSPKERTFYDCTKCPAFCCSVYERVEVKARDLRRLAAHFGITEEEAARRHTRLFDDKERILRRKKDPLLGTTCKFLDLKTRGCSIYEARPAICRTYPARPRCGYYDLYRFEKEQQGDPDVIPLIQLTFRKVEIEKTEPVAKPRKLRASKPANDIAPPAQRRRRGGDALGGTSRSKAAKSPKTSSQTRK